MSYVVRNMTDQVKTLWDLVQEAADGREWYFLDWKGPYNNGDSEDDDAEVMQELNEDMSKAIVFPPHSEQVVRFATGWGGWNVMVVSRIDTGRTKSFLITYWDEG